MCTTLLTRVCFVWSYPFFVAMVNVLFCEDWGTLVPYIISIHRNQVLVFCSFKVQWLHDDHHPLGATSRTVTLSTPLRGSPFLRSLRRVLYQLRRSSGGHAATRACFWSRRPPPVPCLRSLGATLLRLLAFIAGALVNLDWPDALFDWASGVYAIRFPFDATQPRPVTLPTTMCEHTVWVTDILKECCNRAQ